jgi:hypothetical protein
VTETLEARPETSVLRAARRIGMWSAAFTALTTALALALGLVTPPRTGLLCTTDCLAYPYAGAAAYVPGDMLWMIPLFGTAVALLPLVVALGEIVPPPGSVAAHAALAFAALGAGLLMADYALQFGVVAPALLHGHDADVLALSMYNPDGVYVALEDAGYALLGLMFLALAAALPADGRVVRSARWVFAAGGILDLGALAILVGLYGAELGYAYEVTGIGIDLLVLAVAGTLLALWLRDSGRGQPGASGNTSADE